MLEDTCPPGSAAQGSEPGSGVRPEAQTPVPPLLPERPEHGAWPSVPHSAMRLMSEHAGHVLGMAPRPQPPSTLSYRAGHTRVIFPGCGVYLKCDFYGKKTFGGVGSQIHRPFKDRSQDFQETSSWPYPREPIDHPPLLGCREP